MPFRQRLAAVRFAREGIRHPDEAVAAAAHGCAAAVAAHGPGRWLVPVLLVLALLMLVEAVLLRDPVLPAMAIGLLVLAWHSWALRRDTALILRARRYDASAPDGVQP